MDGTATDDAVRRLVLRGQHALTTGVEGLPAALYVMACADGRTAKIGALESAVNADARLRRVEAKHRMQDREPASHSLRLVLVADLEGLVLGTYEDPAFEERWALVEHLESAMRLALARRVGHLARWADWIQVQQPLSAENWVAHVHQAWQQVDTLGRALQPESSPFA